MIICAIYCTLHTLSRENTASPLINQIYNFFTNTVKPVFQTLVMYVYCSQKLLKSYTLIVKYIIISQDEN